MQAQLSRLAPATIDSILLAGLRSQRGPVEEGAIPDVCHIRYQTTPIERQASLDRLVDRGLVSRSRLKKLDRRLPLLDFVEVTIYQATEGGPDVR